MPIIDNLKGDSLEPFKRRTRQLEAQSPLGHASVSRGALRVRSTDGLIVEGSAKVNGTLTGVGTCNWSGPVNLSGTTTQTGPLVVNGTFAVNSGILAASPAAAFFASVTATGAIAGNNGNFTGTLTNSGVASTGNPANVYMTAGGLILRVSSARRFKAEIKDLPVPQSILNVPFRDWIDRAQRKRGEPTDRIPGVIAEEVEELTGSTYVTYDDAGHLDGVKYDRFAIAHSVAVNDRVTELEALLAKALNRIEALEG